MPQSHKPQYRITDVVLNKRQIPQKLLITPFSDKMCLLVYLDVNVLAYVYPTQDANRKSLSYQLMKQIQTLCPSLHFSNDLNQHLSNSTATSFSQYPPSLALHYPESTEGIMWNSSFYCTSIFCCLSSI